MRHATASRAREVSHPRTARRDWRRPRSPYVFRAQERMYSTDDKATGRGDVEPNPGMSATETYQYDARSGTDTGDLLRIRRVWCAVRTDLLPAQE